MFKVVRKQDATLRKIADNKTAANYITKDTSPTVSLATIDATNYYENEVAEYNRIYFVLDGKLTLQFDDEEFVLLPEDTCFVEKGTTYIMKGTFKAAIINQPAFGT
jgi:mannose-6-phosphate isomerase-like protein (cupin superfamily)